MAHKVALRKTPSVRLNFILSFDYLGCFFFIIILGFFWHIKRHM